MQPVPNVDCKNATTGTCLGPPSSKPVQTIVRSPSPQNHSPKTRRLPPSSPPPRHSLKKKTYIVELPSGRFSIPIEMGSVNPATASVTSGSGGSRPYNYTVTADTGSGIVDVACTCCNYSSSLDPGVYNPHISPTYRVPSPSACARFEGGNSSCDWTYTYHPSMQTIGGIIVQDTLSLPTSSPPLTLTSALMGCIQPEGQSCRPESCSKDPTPQGAFGGLDRGYSSIISQVSLLCVY